MNEEILKLADEYAAQYARSGAGVLASEARDKLKATIDNLIHATRAALMKELLAVAGKPLGTLIAKFKGIRTEVYSPDQVAAAVLRQREKDARIAEEPYEFTSAEASRIAAAIRGQE